MYMNGIRYEFIGGGAAELSELQQMAGSSAGQISKDGSRPRSPEVTQDMHEPVPMKKPQFRFRLNGIYIPEIRIQRAAVNGEPVGNLQIAVRDETIGWFTVDDNSHLPHRHYSQFILEYRNETEWSNIDPILRRADPKHGWHKVSPHRLMTILQSAGVIDVDELRDK